MNNPNSRVLRRHDPLFFDLAPNLLPLVFGGKSMFSLASLSLSL